MANGVAGVADVPGDGGTGQTPSPCTLLKIGFSQHGLCHSPNGLVQALALLKPAASAEKHFPYLNRFPYLNFLI